MSNRVRIGRAEIEVSPDHIYLAENLPATYDYVPWNLIARILEETHQANAGLIDVGANVGDTLAHFRRHSQAPALCIEPDPEFFKILERNSSQLGHTTLMNALLAPEELVGKTVFTSGGQTGSSRKSESGEVAWAGRYVTFREVLKFSSGPLVIKTDTDGFDSEILRALIPHLYAGNHFIPLIFFEGPSGKQTLDFQLSEYIDICRSLQGLGYKLLLLTNLGMPYAYVGTQLEQLISCFTALTIGYRHNRCLCHYYDIIALHPDLHSGLHTLNEPWPNVIFTLD